MNKKAVFFSLMAILLISIILVSVKPQSYVTLVNKVPVIQSRVHIANDFVNDINNNYFDRVLFVSGNAALNAYLKNITSETHFDTQVEFEKKLRELMINGTLDGSTKKYNNFTIKYLFKKISDLANSTLKLETKFEIGKSEIYQSFETGPWELAINMSFNYTVNASIAKWNISRNISSRINLIGFEDPLFSINTASLSPSIKRYIHKTNIGKWNVSNLEIFINSSEYKYDNHSPSFIGRMVNDSSSSECCGIQSFINSSDAFNMTNGDLGGTHGFRNKSFIDFCYFESTQLICSDDTWEVVGISTDAPDDSGTDYSFPFRIDPYHMERYNLTSTLDISELYLD